MDFESFERAAMARGALVRTALSLRADAMVMADTTVPQALANPAVMPPLRAAIASVGGTGTVHTHAERLPSGAVRITLTAARKAHAREACGWNAIAA